MGGVETAIEGVATLWRDLSVAELEQVAETLADRPLLWRPQVRHDRDRRHYVQLYRNPFVDVWLICWDQLQETGLHDHDRSAGAVRVVEGTLLEDRFVAAGKAIGLETRAHAAPSCFSFGPAYIHDVRHGGGAPATSIHVYSPALWRMGHYALGPSGFGRSSLTYLDEMAA
jgi:Cysteine dioxygenase type I